MKLVDLETLFLVTYGVNKDLNKLIQDKNGINYVARTKKNNGVTARVKIIEGIEPNPGGTISVSCGGSVLEAFLQESPYYSGRDLVYLTPKIQMSNQEKIYYCMCIRSNKFRYNFGRQPNKSLGKIKIPDYNDIPKYINKIDIKDISHYSSSCTENSSNDKIDVDKWEYTQLSSIFKHERGKRLTKAQQIKGVTPFVTAGVQNQGIIGKIGNIDMIKYKNAITIDMFGNSFYRGYEFCCDDNIIVLINNNNFNKYVLLFISTVINTDKFRYSYGRQYRLEDFKRHKIKLPVDNNGDLDILYMENYIKSLPYTKFF